MQKDEPKKENKTMIGNSRLDTRLSVPQACDDWNILFFFWDDQAALGLLLFLFINIVIYLYMNKKNSVITSNI